MPRFIFASIFILTGFGLGYIFGSQQKPSLIGEGNAEKPEESRLLEIEPKDRHAEIANTPDSQKNNRSKTEAVAAQNPPQLSNPYSEKNDSEKADSEKTESGKTDFEKKGSALDKFTRLLENRRYKEAVDFYQDTERSQPGLAAAFKRELEQFLELKLKSSEFNDFSNLTEYWLNTYYSDLDVLILLADYNSLQGYYGEAISLYQLIYSYANRDGDLARIDSKFSTFVATRDARLIEEEAWYELQSFYEMLEQAGIAKAGYLYRLAEIYLHNGYIDNARYIVEQLLASNRYVNRAQALLTEINNVNDVDYEKRPVHSLSRQILPLEKQGNHFIAVLALQKNVHLKLLIDTGASITAVSYASYAYKVSHTSHTLLPSRLFNTANGVARGEVMLVPSLYFGGEELRDTEIAIVPMPDSGEIDGLLGMNILSQFRFQIDQENAELILDKKGS